MKKLFLLLCIAFFCDESNAQLSKGRMLVSGLANYNKTSSSDNFNPSPKTYVNETNNSKSTAVNLNAGYFLSDHIAVGLYGSYHSNSSESFQTSNSTINSNPSKQNNHLFAAGVFGRYYQMIGSSRFAFFGQVNAAYNWGSGNNYIYSQYFAITSVTDRETTSNGYSLGVAPGMAFFINKSFAVETVIGSFSYNHLINSYSDNGRLAGSGDSSGLNASLALSTIYLGISYYFGGSKTQTP